MIILGITIIALSIIAAVLLAYRCGRQDGQTAERRHNRDVAARLWDKLQRKRNA